MPRIELSLELISPMFLNGADTRQPEMRAASVRGQLRYWLRAIIGAQTDDLSQVWERESAVFGSTGQGSAVTVRVFGDPVLDTYPMLPHREGTQDNVSRALAIKQGQKFDLQLVTRPGVPMPEDAMHALRLWSLLGGLGKRSRRMMGAMEFRPKSTDLGWYERPQTPEAFKSVIIETLNKALPQPVETAEMPRFPVLRLKHSWIIIGKAYDNPKEANQEFFRKLLRNPKFKPSQDVFGFAKGNKRRASPIIAQVRRISGSYYPIITAFQCQPSTKNDLGILRDFMKDALSFYNGIHIWGGW